MKLLQDFVDWTSFCRSYPSFEVLRHDSEEIWCNKPLKDFLKSRGVSDVESIRLLAKYGVRGGDADEGPLRYALATLLGVGKGSENTFVDMMGSFIAKYDGRYVDDMRNLNFVTKMKKCVEGARDMAKFTSLAFDAASDGVLDGAMAQHFGCGRGHPRWDLIRSKVRATMDGLNGVFRLAALHSKDNEASGMVHTKCAGDPGSGRLSPYKTVFVDAWDRRQLHGSIHVNYGLFRTPPERTGGGDGYILKDVAISGVIFHEATHKWAQTDDEADLSQPKKYKKLNVDQRFRNADCYAWVAVSVYLEKVVWRVDEDELIFKHS